MAAYAIISCLFSDDYWKEGAPTIAPGSDMIVNAADFPTGRKARLYVGWWSDSTGTTNYLDLYDRFGAAPVAGSQISADPPLNVFVLSESSPFTLPEGLKSFQIRLWGSVAVIAIGVSKIELQIESG